MAYQNRMDSTLVIKVYSLGCPHFPGFHRQGDGD